MSTGTLTHIDDLAPTESEAQWIVVSPTPLDTEVFEEASAFERGEDWLQEDAVDEFLAKLVHEGRMQEAERVRIALRLPHDDSHSLVRALVSQQWADDWNSEEDSLYDQL